MGEEYTISPSSPNGNLRAYPLDFSKVAMLGNAGAKINALLYGHELSPVAEDQSAGGDSPTSGIGPGIIGATRSTRKFAGKVFNASMGRAGGPGDELLPHELPNGQILSDEEWARHVGKQPIPQILPMHTADP